MKICTPLTCILLPTPKLLAQGWPDTLLLSSSLIVSRRHSFSPFYTTEFGCLLTITEHVTVGRSAVKGFENELGLRVFPQPHQR
ncbi:MAG: hypothetical protein GC192_03615 [Bacteroidetes bacterium]|nr:hypothetical protein [Bacteroidota bacterium]